MADDTKQLPPPTEPEDELAGTEAPLLEHLTELRRRLIISAATILVLTVVCFGFADFLFDLLLGPFKRAVPDIEDVQLIYTAPQEFFFTKVSLALFGAIFLSFPVVATQIYLFVAPGLYKKERFAFLPYLIATPLFFLLGALMVYFAVLPLAMNFFLGMQWGGPGSVTITMQTRVSEYLGLAMTLILAFGVCFQLPVILTLLAQIDLVHVESLRKGRRYAIVAIVALAALFSPPDPFSQIGLAIPMLLLYELAILSVARIERRRAARLVAEGLSTAGE